MQDESMQRPTTTATNRDVCDVCGGTGEVEFAADHHGGIRAIPADGRGDPWICPECASKR